MSNKRELKQAIKYRTNQLMEDAFSYTLNHPGDNDEKADQLIEKIADKWFELVAKVNNYPKKGKRAEVKKYFSDIKEELDKVATEFNKEVDALYKS
tara:strand:- start:1672 stop:1959 length:288 start_codon:yes stop_codon:yes gene_type:complete